MEHNDNQVIIEVTEKKNFKEKAKAFVQKHKSKLIGGALVAGTAVLTTIVCKIKNHQDEDEESEEQEVLTVTLAREPEESYEEYEETEDQVEEVDESGEV